MIGALKVTLIIYGVIGVVLRMLLIAIPGQLGAMMGFEAGPSYVMYFMASFGGSLVAASVFVIKAARDPVRHISWVNFAIAWSLVSVVTASYSLVRGYVDFGQVGVGIIIDAVFAAAFLAFYPYRAARA